MILRLKTLTNINGDKKIIIMLFIVREKFWKPIFGKIDKSKIVPNNRLSFIEYFNIKLFDKVIFF